MHKIKSMIVEIIGGTTLEVENVEVQSLSDFDHYLQGGIQGNIQLSNGKLNGADPALQQVPIRPDTSPANRPPKPRAKGNYVWVKPRTILRLGKTIKQKGHWRKVRNKRSTLPKNKREMLARRRASEKTMADRVPANAPPRPSRNHVWVNKRVFTNSQDVRVEVPGHWRKRPGPRS